MFTVLRLPKSCPLFPAHPRVVTVLTDPSTSCVLFTCSSHRLFGWANTDTYFHHVDPSSHPNSLNRNAHPNRLNGVSQSDARPSKRPLLAGFPGFVFWWPTDRWFVPGAVLRSHWLRGVLQPGQGRLCVQCSGWLLRSPCPADKPRGPLQQSLHPLLVAER
jgi:hypothetical protein